MSSQSQFMLQVADVLEKVATYVDENEAARQEATRVERRRTADTLNEKIAAATGERLPDAVLEKIASSDQDVVEAVVKLAERHAERPPDELGEPGDIRDNRTGVATTKTARIKEASEDADQRFLSWING